MNRCLPIILVSYLTNIYYEFLLNCLITAESSALVFFCAGGAPGNILLCIEVRSGTGYILVLVVLVHNGE